eukprot:4883870-Prymnesium_polylepis.1
MVAFQSRHAQIRPLSLLAPKEAGAHRLQLRLHPAAERLSVRARHCHIRHNRRTPALPFGGLQDVHHDAVQDAPLWLPVE